MSRYIIIDGQIQRASPGAARWHQRAAQVVPTGHPEPQEEPVVDLTDLRSAWEIIEGLEENE